VVLGLEFRLVGSVRLDGAITVGARQVVPSMLCAQRSASASARTRTPRHYALQNSVTSR
jgi:hypothetical protein